MTVVLERFNKDSHPCMKSLSFSKSIILANPKLSLHRIFNPNISASFERMWGVLNGPILRKEFQFHNVRKWRFDFCHLPTSTGIEIEGGIFSQQHGKKAGHSSGTGITKDIEKYNAAQFLGFSVIRLSSNMITTPKLQEIIDFINARSKS